MPKIGMESLYQGYLQNLEAEKSKKTRRPTATQYTDKQPNERNDFDRFCAVIEIMRKALGPNVPFGGEGFSIGYYNFSKVRRYETGETEFESVFGDLWDNLEAELDKHKDVVDRLKPEEKAAVQAVLDVKAKEREEKRQELDRQKEKPAANPQPELQQTKVDLNETIQYGDELDLDKMNETVVLTDDELRKINEELEKKQKDKKEPTAETKPEARQNAPKTGMESLYQGYLQNLEAEKNKQTRLPTAVQYTEKKPEERNDFDRFCMAVETMRKALGPNVPFGNDNFIRGYYEISKKRKHEIGEAEFTSVFGDLWDNFNEELGKHKDVLVRLKPEEKAAVRAVLDLKAKEREAKEREAKEREAK
ncbi:MAG: hypothetical protein IJQ98_11765, partial [Oscillospiraceae bacterium]|nr:hypothetical protein [Oscillospiraceae bacterium]